MHIIILENTNNSRVYTKVIKEISEEAFTNHTIEGGTVMRLRNCDRF